MEWRDVSPHFGYGGFEGRSANHSLERLIGLREIVADLGMSS